MSDSQPSVLEFFNLDQARFFRAGAVEVGELEPLTFSSVKRGIVTLDMEVGPLTSSGVERVKIYLTADDAVQVGQALNEAGEYARHMKDDDGLMA